jgi:hypothetical protein
MFMKLALYVLKNIQYCFERSSMRNEPLEKSKVVEFC